MIRSIYRLSYLGTSIALKSTSRKHLTSIVSIYLTLHSIRLLLEICTAMEPPMEQGRTFRLLRSNRHGIGFNDIDKRLSELQQKFEEACSQRSGFDTTL